MKRTQVMAYAGLGKVWRGVGSCGNSRVRWVGTPVTPGKGGKVNEQVDNSFGGKEGMMRYTMERVFTVESASP